MAGVTRNSVINLDQTLFSHESQLDPVFSAWREDRDIVFLRVDSLPNHFVGVYIPDIAILDQLELGGDPLSVCWHTETQVEAVFNWDAENLGLITWVDDRLLAFGGGLLFIGLASFSLLLFLGFPVGDLGFCLKPLQVRDDDGIDLNGSFVYVKAYLLGQKLLFSSGNIFCAHIH